MLAGVSTLNAIRNLSNHGRFAIGVAPKMRHSPKLQRVEIMRVVCLRI
jgi:hypothetical protein